MKTFEDLEFDEIEEGGIPCAYVRFPCNAVMVIWEKDNVLNGGKVYSVDLASPMSISHYYLYSKQEVTNEMIRLQSLGSVEVKERSSLLNKGNYEYFDSGKKSTSRRGVCTILTSIKYGEMDNATQRYIKEKVYNNPHLYELPSDETVIYVGVIYYSGVRILQYILPDLTNGYTSLELLNQWFIGDIGKELKTQEDIERFLEGDNIRNK